MLLMTSTPLHSSMLALAILSLASCGDDSNSTPNDASGGIDVGSDARNEPDAPGFDADNTDGGSDTSAVDAPGFDADNPDAGPCAEDCVEVLEFVASAGSRSITARVTLATNAACAVEYRLVGEDVWQTRMPTEDSADYGADLPHIQLIEDLDAGEYEVRARDHVSGSYMSETLRVVVAEAAPTCGAGFTRWALPADVAYGGWTQGNWETLFPGASGRYGNGDGNVQTRMLDGQLAQIQRVIPTPPGSNGSSRVAGAWNLPVRNRYRLVQSIRLEDDFAAGVEVQSGKLGYGIGGGSVPSGGNPRDDGFLVRVGFRGDGSQPDTRAPVRPTLYVYSADQEGRYGDEHDLTIDGSTVLFQRGQWMAIEVEVVANSTAGARDGEFRAWVDGQLAYEETGKMWFGSGTPSVGRMTLSTFHGGADSRWAPSTTNEIAFSSVCLGD